MATPLAAEGLTFTDGTDIVLRDNAEGLAAACVQLLQDPSLAVRLGLAARERAGVTYERDAAVARLERLFRSGSGAIPAAFPA